MDNLSRRKDGKNRVESPRKGNLHGKGSRDTKAAPPSKDKLDSKSSSKGKEEKGRPEFERLGRCSDNRQSDDRRPEDRRANTWRIQGGSSNRSDQGRDDRSRNDSEGGRRNRRPERPLHYEVRPKKDRHSKRQRYHPYQIRPKKDRHSKRQRYHPYQVRPKKDRHSKRQRYHPYQLQSDFITEARYTKDNSNCLRLFHLIMEWGTMALITTFDMYRPKGSLREFLDTEDVRKTIEACRDDKIISTAQWRTLYGFSPSLTSAALDITLLVFLMRNVIQWSAPKGGWDGCPPEKDISPQADVLRIKNFRNDIAHGKMSMDDVQFEKTWGAILKTLVRLLGKHRRDEINGLKKQSIDPAMEAHYQKKLRELREQISFLEGESAHADATESGAIAKTEEASTTTSLTTYSYINHSRTSITDDTAKAFAEAIKTNNTLTHLGVNFSGTSITDDGATAFAKAIKTNKTLKTINLDLSGTSTGKVEATQSLTRTAARVTRAASTTTSTRTVSTHDAKFQNCDEHHLELFSNLRKKNDEYSKRTKKMKLSG